ncbi:MAG: nucleoside monophosphate kinase, partial [Chlorobiales bacterium]|nr:nucleoside monophosphate kinase [Chlorobiales bacterium]
IKEGTQLGLEAKSYIDKGELVPDNVIIGMIEEVIANPSQSKSGFILDGFPRTVPQAEALDVMLKKYSITIDRVISLVANEEEIVKRLSGRRIAPSSGKVYHIMFNPPKIDGKCDETGEALIIRDDDKEDTVRKRLTVYRNSTEPVLAYYRKQDNVSEIDGTKTIEEVSKEIDEILMSFAR